MTLSVSVPAVNLREVADEVCAISARVAKNANALRPLQAYAGKNLLMNGNKSLSQRGNFSTPVAVVTGTFYIDRYSVDIANLTAEFSHNNGVNRVEATSVGANSFLQQTQKIENWADFARKTLTYTAEVRTNYDDVSISARFGGSRVHSKTITPDEEWHEVSFSFTVIDTVDRLIVYVGSVIEGVSLSNAIGDYFETRNEQLELGSEFTGFEVVNPATQLMQCRRYFQLKSTIHQVDDLAYEMRTTPVQGGVAGAYTYAAEL